MASDNAAPKKRTFSWKQARLLISVFLLVFFFLIGRGIGKTTGDLIGKAAGSYDGVMRANDAMEAGAEAGLSAEDIETTLVHTFTQAGRLQILSVNTHCDNFMVLGEDERRSTKSLVIYPVSATFSVDHSQTVIEADPNSHIITVTLPQPEAKISIDFENYEEIFTKEDLSPFVGTDDGRDAQNNVQGKMQEAIQNALESELIDEARQAAVSQVYRLCQMLSDGTYTISQSSITFQ